MAFVVRRGLAQSPFATGLMVFAVAIGVAFQIPNSANLDGYQHEILRQGVTSGFGDIRVRPRQGRHLQNASAIATALARHPEVIATVPIVTRAGAVGGSGGFEDAYVVGVDHDAAVAPYALARGAPLGRDDTTGILIGSALARRVGADVGSEVQLRVFLTISSELSGEDALGRYTATVRGIVAGGFVAPSAVFMNRSFLNAESGSTAATAILVHARDHERARPLAAELSREHPELAIVAWNDDNPFLDAAVKSSSTINTVSYAMITVAIVIPVWALLNIGVLHRKRQVALMIAIGFSRAAVFWAFLLQALAIGLLGTVLGCLGGYALVRYFGAHPIFAIDTFSIVPAHTLRTYLEPALVVLAATVFAGVWPAHRASRLEPSRVLRTNR